MSETVMTVAFGATNRNNGNPRFVRVIADLVVGGSGVFIFHKLHGDTPVRPVRIRPDDAVSEATVLMAGLGPLNRPGSGGGSQSMEDESHGSTQEVPR
ncbi:hypothetical protein, partial [Nocardioides ganghwensis]|uniref:hypothetical protein n=1 Tax=Nocardioides ganghwensis TaxID=252230 RepID=UPI001A910927